MNVSTCSNASTGWSAADERRVTAWGSVWWPRSRGSTEQASTWKTPPPVSKSGCDFRLISDRSDQIGSNKITAEKSSPGSLRNPGCLADPRNALVKLDPALAAPVAAALMFAPPETLARTPCPVVRMDGDAGIGRIFVGGRGVPANVFTTHDRGRCAERRKRQNAGARSRTKKKFSHLQPPYVSVRKERDSWPTVPRRDDKLSSGGHPAVGWYRAGSLFTPLRGAEFTLAARHRLR